MPSAGATDWGTLFPSSSWDPANSSPKSDSCPASRRWSTALPRRTRGASHSDRRPARAVGRRSRARRAHDARAHPAPRSPDRNGAGGPVLVGPATSPDVVRLQGFLTRNGYPHQVLDPAEDAEAKALVERYAPEPARPAACRVRRRNRAQEPERGGTGALPRHGARRCAGPDLRRCHRRRGTAGLATAVYAASEGSLRHRVRCARLRRAGGASARIENYLGFPTGISGQALTGRAFVQAQKFGAEMVIPVGGHRARLRRLRLP